MGVCVGKSKKQTEEELKYEINMLPDQRRLQYSQNIQIQDNVPLQNSRVQQYDMEINLLKEQQQAIESQSEREIIHFDNSQREKDSSYYFEKPQEILDQSHILANNIQTNKKKQYQFQQVSHDKKIIQQQFQLFVTSVVQDGLNNNKSKAFIQLQTPTNSSGRQSDIFSERRPSQNQMFIPYNQEQFDKINVVSDWENGFVWKGVYFKKVIKFQERKLLKQSYRSLKYLAMDYERATNTFIMDGQKIHIQLPLLQIVEHGIDLYYGSPVIYHSDNSILNNVKVLQQYQTINSSFIFQNIRTLNKLNRSTHDDQYFVIGDYNLPQIKQNQIFLYIPHHKEQSVEVVHGPLNQQQCIDFIESKLDQSQDNAQEIKILDLKYKLIQSVKQFEPNERATQILSTQISGDIVMIVERRSQGISMNPGIYLDNELLKQELKKINPSPILNKAINNIYHKQLDTFIKQLNSLKTNIPFPQLVEHLSRNFLKKSHAYQIYLRLNNQYYKKCFACLIIIMAMKKIIVSGKGDFLTEIILVINQKLSPLVEVLFFRTIYLSDYYPQMTSQQSKYLLSDQFTQEIIKTALESSQILAYAIEWKFGIKFTDQISRKIKTDCFYFSSLKETLSISHLQVASMKNTLPLTFRERAYLLYKQTNGSFMKSINSPVQFLMPPSLYRYDGKLKHNFMLSSHDQLQDWVAYLEVMFSEIDPDVVIEALLYQCALQINDEDQCKFTLDKIVALMSTMHECQPQMMIIVYILLGYLCEKKSQLDSQQNYLLAMMLTHNLHGDPRGRGAINTEWEQFICSRMHLMNLSGPQDLELVREIWEASGTDSIFGHWVDEQSKQIDLSGWILEQLGWVAGNDIKWSTKSIQQLQLQIMQSPSQSVDLQSVSTHPVSGTTQKTFSVESHTPTIDLTKLLERDYWTLSRAPGQILIWGFNSNGQIGTKNPENSKVKFLYPRLVTALKNEIILQITCGHKHTLALNMMGHMFGWGCNDQGQCGQDPIKSNIYTPAKIDSIVMYHLSCGHDHSVALSKDGRVYTWGAGEGGLLGHGGTESSHIPTMITTLKDITMVQCGGLHTVALDRQGNLFSWGRNEGSQLGIVEFMSHGEERFQSTPVQLKLVNIKQVALGDAHSLALNRDGQVFGWGYCNAGQLGLGVCDEMYQGSYVYPNPTLIESLVDIKIIRIYSGSMFSLFLTDKYQLLSCGLNDKYQNGHEHKEHKMNYKGRSVYDYTIPMIITLFEHTPVLILCAGNNHTICVINDIKKKQVLVQGKRYKIYSWGINKHAQLARGADQVQYGGPRPIVTYSNQITFSMGAGGYHSCLLTGNIQKFLEAQKQPQNTLKYNLTILK